MLTKLRSLYDRLPARARAAVLRFAKAVAAAAVPVAVKGLVSGDAVPTVLVAVGAAALLAAEKYWTWTP